MDEQKTNTSKEALKLEIQQLEKEISKSIGRDTMNVALDEIRDMWGKVSNEDEIFQRVSKLNSRLNKEVANKLIHLHHMKREFVLGSPLFNQLNNNIKMPLYQPQQKPVQIDSQEQRINEAIYEVGRNISYLEKKGEKNEKELNKLNQQLKKAEQGIGQSNVGQRLVLDEVPGGKIENDIEQQRAIEGLKSRIETLEQGQMRLENKLIQLSGQKEELEQYKRLNEKNNRQLKALKQQEEQQREYEYQLQQKQMGQSGQTKNIEQQMEDIQGQRNIFKRKDEEYWTKDIQGQGQKQNDTLKQENRDDSQQSMSLKERLRGLQQQKQKNQRVTLPRLNVQQKGLGMSQSNQLLSNQYKQQQQKQNNQPIKLPRLDVQQQNAQGKKPEITAQPKQQKGLDMSQSSQLLKSQYNKHVKFSGLGGQEDLDMSQSNQSQMMKTQIMNSPVISQTHQQNNHFGSQQQIHQQNVRPKRPNPYMNQSYQHAEGSQVTMQPGNGDKQQNLRPSKSNGRMLKHYLQQNQYTQQHQQDHPYISQSNNNSGKSWKDSYNKSKDKDSGPSYWKK